MAKVVITFGTFDLFHIGHINILKKAKSFGDRLIVGVSSDILSIKKKFRCPVFNQDHRIKILQSCKYVDGVFLEESLEKKTWYIKHYKCNVLVMGDDWTGKFDWVKSDNPNLEVKYLERTKNVSSTGLMKQITENMYGHVKLNGTYVVDPVLLSEIFPLKKYKFYDRMLWGPKEYKTMSKWYGKKIASKYSNIMKYAYRKWNKKKVPFLIRGKDKNPAKIVSVSELSELSDNISGCNRNTKNCLITKNKKRKNEYYTPVCCASLLVKLLFDITNFLESHNILYFIYWGTLLGSLRHKGLIPWDTDVDIYILEFEVDKLLSLVKDCPLDYIFKKIDDKQYRFTVSEKNHRHLDIYIASFI